MEDSTLSLDVDHRKLGIDPKVTSTKERTVDDVLVPAVKQKFAKIRENYNELRIEFDGGYAVVFRAYNEGVAYRFETSLPQSQVKIYGEEAKFHFAADSIVYYAQEDSFFSHNERKYLPQKLSEIIPTFIGTLPAVVGCGRWREGGYCGV